MGSELVGTYTIIIIDKVGVLFVTLNKSKLVLKWMIILLVRITLSKDKSTSEIK